MLNSIFVNLPVVSLKKSVAFFTELGFTFNPQFTDETSTCMIVNDKVYVMLVEHAKFSAFIDKPIAPSSSTEAIFSFSCESKDDVVAMASKAHSLGARKVNEAEDMGFMFSWGFEDLDGHLWDLFWMNPEHVQG
jgi:predicted lactoylglutathione lyase